MNRDPRGEVPRDEPIGDGVFGDRSQKAQSVQLRRIRSGVPGEHRPDVARFELVQFHAAEGGEDMFFEVVHVFTIRTCGQIAGFVLEPLLRVGPKGRFRRQLAADFGFEFAGQLFFDGFGAVERVPHLAPPFELLPGHRVFPSHPDQVIRTQAVLLWRDAFAFFAFAHFAPYAPPP